MNVVNPASATPTSGVDQRLYEPSMEEILASIRRIIADDQRLPGPSGHAGVSPTADATPAPAKPVVGVDSYSIQQQHAPAFEHSDADRSPPVLVGEPSEIDAAPSHTAPRVDMSASKSPTLTPPAEASQDESSALEPFMSVAAGIAPRSPAMLHSERDGQGASVPAGMADAELTEMDVPVGGLEDEAESIDPYFDPPIERDEPLPKAEPPAGLFSTHTTQSVTSSFNLLAATRLADNSDELLGLAREMIRPLLKTWLDDNLPSMVERMVRAEIERVARGGRD